MHLLFYVQNRSCPSNRQLNFKIIMDKLSRLYNQLQWIAQNAKKMAFNILASILIFAFSTYMYISRIFGPLMGKVLRNSGSKRNFIEMIILWKYNHIGGFFFLIHGQEKTFWSVWNWILHTYLYLFYKKLSIFGKSKHYLWKNENQLGQTFLRLCRDSSTTQSCGFRMC